MDDERKDRTDGESARYEPAHYENEGRERADEALHAQVDVTNQEALKESARLGGGGTYSIGPKIGIDFRKARCVDSKS